MLTEDTIVAIATPSGRGGVGIVRLSGAKAYDIALALTKRDVLTPRFAYFSPIFLDNNEILDEGLVIYFKAPFSFTGEEVVEFQLHGSPIILDELITRCLLKGARLATHGEFSLRAYLNDKMDLTQAEAIADLINASTTTAARMAMRSLQGDFSKRIEGLNQQIIYLRTYVEAMIDFPEEEIDTITFKTIENHFSSIKSLLDDILSVATQGSLIREGITIVIAGRPNAGKSTLINALAKREVAIVTEVPGTTRDVMKEYLLIDDIPVHVLDTAGLRDSDDKVEQEGIKRAWGELKKADCILLVNDAQTPESLQLENDIRAHVDSIPIIKVWNKIDLGDKSLMAEGVDEVKISAKHQRGLVALKNLIKQKIGYQPVEGQFLARRRHLDALNQAKALIKNAHEHIFSSALELLAEDLRLAHDALTSITGEFSSDDLLGQIFSSFCIGK